MDFRYYKHINIDGAGIREIPHDSSSLPGFGYSESTFHHVHLLHLDLLFDSDFATAGWMGFLWT
jgi:hypothetical protein